MASVCTSTAIMGAFLSSLEELVEFARERFPLRTFAPLAMVLAAGATMPARAGIAPVLARDSLVALSLLFQFRLADDLADRAKDRVLAPARVLVRTRRPRVFARAMVVAFALNACWLGAVSLAAAFSLVVMSGAYALFYREGVRERMPALLVHHLVVAKYPLFVLLLASDRLRAAPAAAIAYLAMAVYEVAHDPRVRAVRGAVACATLELGVACALAAIVVGRAVGFG